MAESVTPTAQIVQEGDGMIDFSRLTWPEAAALNKDWPVILPLGESTQAPAQELLSALGCQQAIRLPAWPYGLGSESVLGRFFFPEQLAKKLLQALIQAIKGQGFHRVVVLGYQPLA